MSNEEIEAYKKEKEYDSVNGFGRWAWFAMLEKIATWKGGDMEAAEQMNYIAALNLLSYWKERDKEIEKINKQETK